MHTNRALALCAAILLIAFSSGYKRPGDPMDEGEALVYPELIQHGAIPYRDFETVYAPGNWYFLAGVYALFGTHIRVERTVGLLYNLVCVFAIFAIARRWNTTTALACALLAGAILISNGIEALSWMGAMAFALSAIALLASSRYLSAGIFAGIAILFRADLAPALLLAAIPLIWNLERKNFLALGITAIATALLPMLLLACYTGIAPILHNIFFLPVIQSAPALKIPFPTADLRLRLLFAVHLLALLFNIGAAVIALSTFKDRNAAFAFLATTLFAVGITYEPYHRLDFIHLVFALFVSIPFLPLSVQILRPSVPPLACAAVLFLCMPRIRNETWYAFVRSKPESSWIERYGRTFPVASFETALAVSELVAKLDAISQPGQTLFVGPADLRRANYCDTFIYHLMPKLRPASYFLEMAPNGANAPDSRLTGDLAQADWLVLNRAWDEWPGPSGPDAPMQVVANDFRLAAERGTFVLYQRVTTR